MVRKGLAKRALLAAWLAAAGWLLGGCVNQIGEREMIDLSHKAIEPAVPAPVKKSKAGRILLTIFAVFALLAGSALGFVTGRGIVNWREYLPGNHFTWTDFSEGFSQPDETPEEIEEEEEKAS